MKISIGIPFYNPGDDFKDAINSVLKQTYKNFELILLDDGSSDNSLNIARSFSDERIKIISDGTNKGLPARLNELIELSEGYYIARMDADDIISSSRIEQQVKVLNENPNVDMVTTGLCSITNDNKVVGYRLPSRQNGEHISASDAIFGKADIAHATVLVRKEWYQRNKYNEKAKLMEDFQLWIDAAIKQDLKVAHVKQPLYFYREESSTSLKKSIRAYINCYKIVFNQYFQHLSLWLKIKLTLLTSAKIFFVTVAAVMRSYNPMLTLRNKGTQQNQLTLNSLQKELDSIRQK